MVRRTPSGRSNGFLNTSRISQRVNTYIFIELWFQQQRLNLPSLNQYMEWLKSAAELVWHILRQEGVSQAMYVIIGPLSKKGWEDFQIKNILNNILDYNQTLKCKSVLEDNIQRRKCCQIIVFYSNPLLIRMTWMWYKTVFDINYIFKWDQMSQLSTLIIGRTLKPSKFIKIYYNMVPNYV